MHRIPVGVAAATLLVALSTTPEPAPSSPRYPLPAAPLRALPSLDNSDPVVREGVTKLAGGEALAPRLAANGVIRRFVVYVDAVAGGRERPAPDVLHAVALMEARPVAAMYSRFYPLMQQAYDEEVRSGGYFNDRLVQAIDRVLADSSAAAVPAHERLRDMRALVALRTPGR